MKTCPSCSNLNNDESLFCVKCGTSLEEQSLVNNEQNDFTIDTTQSNADGVKLEDHISEGTDPSSTKKKPKVFVYTIGIVAVIAAILLVVNFISNANPANKLIRGFVNLSKADKISATTTIDIGYRGGMEAAKLLNDFTFKIDSAADIDNLLGQITLDILYENKSITKAAVGANNEIVYADLYDLYKEKIYGEVDEDYKEFINDYKIVKKAIDKISIKFDQKAYMKIIQDVLEDEINRSGNKITITMNIDTVVELLTKLLEEAEGDKKLMESVRTNGISFIKAIVKEEKNFEQLDVDDLEDVLEEFEDKKDFQNNYEYAISNILSELEDIEDNYENSIKNELYYSGIPASFIEELFEIDLTFSFSGNNIKGVEFTEKFRLGKESYEITVNTDIKKGASFTSINKKKAIEFEEIEDDFYDFAEEITGNFTNAIKKNKGLKNKIEDLAGEDIEDVIESLIYNMF